MDASLFDPAAIDEQTAAFNAELESLLALETPIYKQTPREVREARAAGKGVRGPVVRSEKAIERAVAGPAGDIPLRVFLPSRVEGVYLHIHGGGWVLGGHDMQDQRLEAIASACRLAVVSVGYRLAPEHPYPAGPDDCEATALWLARHARDEFGSECLVIGGESAGAHLALVTLLRLRDRHGLSPFLGASLSYGVYDLRGTPSVRNWGERNLILSTPVMQWFFDHFVSQELRDEPDVSPLLADLRGMPPALLSIGTLDPLLDDSLFLHSRLLAAGVDSSLHVYPGGIHGFSGYPIALAQTARQREEDFLRARVAAP